VQAALRRGRERAAATPPGSPILRWSSARAPARLCATRVHLSAGARAPKSRSRHDRATARAWSRALFERTMRTQARATRLPDAGKVTRRKTSRLLPLRWPQSGTGIAGLRGRSS
jgi:hypothetical protein